MALPTITITTETIAQPPLIRIDEVVGVIGPIGTAGGGTAGTGAVGTIYHQNTLQGTGNILAAALGDNGDAFDVIRDMLSQVSVDVVFSPLTVVPATGLATQANWDAALNALRGYTRSVTTVLIPRDYTQGVNATGAGTGVASLETFCDNIDARAVISAPQDTVANAVSWGGANAGPYVMGVFNGPSGRLPAGLWLGAALRVAATNREGRGHGIQLARVTGAGTLQHVLNIGVTDLDNLDAANVSSIVDHNNRHVITGGEFNYTSDTELQRDWAIARVVDHAKHLLIDRWDDLVGSTRPISVLATRLEEALAPIVGTEIVSGVVSGVSGAQGHKIFNLDLDIIHPVTSVEVHIRITEVVGT